MRPPGPRWTPEDVRELARRTVTTSVEIAGAVLGMSRSAAYDAVRRGTFPVPVLQVTRRHWVVPTAALLHLLELDDAPADGPSRTAGPEPPEVGAVAQPAR